MKLNRMHMAAVAVGVVAIGTMAPQALASPSSGLTVTTLVTARLNHAVRVETDRIKFRTKAATNIRVQNFVFAPGAVSGWHHHPGMVLIAVQSGSVTVWNSECHSKTYGPGLPDGSAFVEGGDDAGQVTSTGGASTFVTYVVPAADVPIFRVEDAPPPCA